MDREKRVLDLDAGITEEQTTAAVWKEIASEQVPGIKFTTDCPSQYPDGYVPVLDFKVRMVRMDLGKDPDGENLYIDRIEHKFYKKPTANWLIV